jgi:DNA sulfur modification protein DndC
MKIIDFLIDEIIDQYMYADETTRPWIIGFSGGKDSTVLLQLVWKALQKVKQFSGLVKRDIYIVCNDTMVENPIIAEYVRKVLQKIEEAARNQDLPIFVKQTFPRLEDSYWVNLIGKGYPTPNSNFRWCTERLKIKPTSRYITEQLDANAEAILLLGVRSNESANRARTIKQHEVKGKRLSKHPNHANAYIYTPIKDLTTEDVWYIINTMPSPWGSNNQELFDIYTSASSDDYECPTMVTNKEHKSCGQSRFGCWVCTVVKEDKSMTALVENGGTWLKPLLDLRNQISEERSNPAFRQDSRRNGQRAVNEDGENNGTYTIEYRASVLERLLMAQKNIQQMKPHFELITNQELIAIQIKWARDLYFDFSVATIYNKIYNQHFNMENLTNKKQQERSLLTKVCNDEPEYIELIENMLTIQKNKSLMNRKRGLKDDLEDCIESYLKKNQSTVVVQVETHKP